MFRRLSGVHVLRSRSKKSVFFTEKSVEFGEKSVPIAQGLSKKKTRVSECFKQTPPPPRVKMVMVRKLRNDYQKRIKSISMCSLIEHPKCPNNALVNKVLRSCIEACRGIVTVLNHTLVSADHWYLNPDANLENPYQATCEARI